jgi:Spy/CpxP family protein refolding chaperone
MTVRFSRRIPAVCLIVFSLLAIAFVPASALAQGRQGRGQGAGGGAGAGRGDMVERTQTIANELMNLTADQKTKLDAIFAKAKEDFKAAQEASRDLPPEERGPKMREMMTALQDQVRGVLTDEQKKEFDDKVQQGRRGGPGAQGGGQGAGQGGQRGGGARQALQRFRDAIDKLDLTEEQKPKVKQAMDDADQKFQEARKESQGDQQAMREKGRAIVENLTAQLKEVLTPEQQEKLREAIRPDGAGGGQRGPRGGNGNGPATAPSTQPSKDAGSNAGRAGDGLAMVPNQSSPGSPPGVPDRLEVGQVAPDFRLTKLDGTPVQLSSFKGKILLLAFGSYTSPSFRQRAAALDELRRDYGVKISMLVVYTREAHPAGGWEVDRNRDAEIAVPDHKDLLKRRDVAREGRDRLKLKLLPFAVDSMEDEAAIAYHAQPNDAAVLIGKDGTVLAYQKWFDGVGMRAAIVEALGAK